MQAASLDITINQGSTWRRRFFFFTKTVAQDGTVTKTPINLTGFTFAGQLRQTLNADLPAAVMSITVLPQAGATLGYAEALLTDAQTSALPVAKQGKDITVRTPAVFAYDIERTQPNGDKQAIFVGVFNVIPEATRVGA